MVYLILELLETFLPPELIIQDDYLQLTKQDGEACLNDVASLIRDAEFVPFETPAR